MASKPHGLYHNGSWACASPELPAAAFAVGLQPEYAVAYPRQYASQGSPATPKK